MNQVEKAEQYIKQHNTHQIKRETDEKSVKGLTLFFLGLGEMNWSSRSIGDIYMFLLNYYPKLRLQTVLNTLMGLTEKKILYTKICHIAKKRMWAKRNQLFVNTNACFISEPIDEYHIDYIGRIKKRKIKVNFNGDIKGVEFQINSGLYGHSHSKNELNFKI